MNSKYLLYYLLIITNISKLFVLKMSTQYQTNSLIKLEGIRLKEGKITNAAKHCKTGRLSLIITKPILICPLTDGLTRLFFVLQNRRNKYPR
jgi:hypothetical protein